MINTQTIQNWYCNRLNNAHPNYNNLIGYWKLNEGSGNMALDYWGGFGIPNGTINNAVWYLPDSIWIYDYSNTPRITDVPVTALTHLCVPININWLLDGQSLIPYCNTTGTEEINNHIKGLIKISDILGRDVSVKKNTPLFYLYNDGTVEKKIIIE